MGQTATLSGYVFKESGTGTYSARWVMAVNATNGAAYPAPPNDSTVGAWAYQTVSYTVPTWFVCPCTVQLIAQLNTGGTTDAARFDDGVISISSPGSPTPGQPLLYAEDMLGTSRVMTLSNGVVCYDADFYPYGGERAPYTNTCSQNVYKFEGKERDSETGNDEFGARYYSNRFGRWLSADWSAVPIAVPYANLSNPQTLNLYVMVSDDPESFADLDGHCIPWCTAAVGAAAGFLGDILYQKISNPHKSIDWKEAGGAAVAGAIVGGTGGLASAPASILTLAGETTLAAGSTTTLAVTGAAVGGVVGGVAERTINTGSYTKATNDPGEIATDAVTNGATEGLGRGVEKGVEKLAGGAVKELSSQLPRARTANRVAKTGARLDNAKELLEQKKIKVAIATGTVTDTANRVAKPSEKKE